MNSLDRFTTNRLVAEKMDADAFDELCRMHSDPRVMATLGGVRSDAETDRFLREKMAHWETYGYGYWMFRDKENGEFTGRGGIQHIEVGGKQEIEIGYSVLAELWGRGLATEMAGALVEIALERLGLDNLVCFTLTTNTASARVMQKAGFTFERTFTHEGEPHLLYRLRREGEDDGGMAGLRFCHA